MYNETGALFVLRPRIWEILPDHIKKRNSFGLFKLKLKLWNPENCPCRLSKIYYHI